MRLKELLPALFPRGHDVSDRDQLVRGTGETAEGTVAVLGTSGPAAIGTRLALALAEGVLDVVEQAPGRPIVFLVDTSGQTLSRHEEMLGLNGYLSFGLMTDRSYALADAQIRVMDLKAMSRVTKLPFERLVDLAAESPVFAPGAENYLRMGALHAIWREPSAQLLEQAIAELRRDRAGALRDTRNEVGFDRGGRSIAKPTIAAMLAAG